eukprot:UN03711
MFFLSLSLFPSSNHPHPHHQISFLLFFHARTCYIYFLFLISP